jgi:hypothetical protein
VLKKFNINTINLKSYRVQQTLQLRLVKLIKELHLAKKILILNNSFRNTLLSNQPRFNTKIFIYKKYIKKIYSKINRINFILSKIKRRQYLSKKRQLISYKKQYARNFIRKFKEKQFQYILQKLTRFSKFRKQIRRKSTRKLFKILKKKLKKKRKWIYKALKKQFNKILIKFLCKNFSKQSLLNFNLYTNLNNLQKKTLTFLFNQKQFGFKVKKMYRPFVLNNHKNLRKQLKAQHKFIKIESDTFNKCQQNQSTNKKINMQTYKNKKINIKYYRHTFRKNYRKQLNILVRYQYKL